MEFLYHYLWKHRLAGRKFTTTDGRLIEVINPGSHNTDAGPDFFNSRLCIDGTEWAGNVEIHVKASDWFRHGHDKDAAYNSVILHVVGVDDGWAKRADGVTPPQICVAPAPDFFNTYLLLSQKIDEPRCLSQLSRIPVLNITDWMESLGFERLSDKAAYMEETLRFTRSDWRQTLFILIARALGFGLNGLPFELVAKALPLNFLLRHSDNLMQIEAMIFGVAGMLDDSVPVNDPYYHQLCREFRFLQTKYRLQPIPPGLWKYSRTRPGNFPHRRLAILASMICSGMQFHDKMVEAKGDPTLLAPLFSHEASDYWKQHSNFGMPSSTPLPAKLSHSSIEIVLANVAAPFYFVYSKTVGNPELAEAGANLLNNLKPERNAVTMLWERVLPPAASAFETQARLNLKRNYCEKDRCLDCRFGHYLLRHSFRTAAGS